MTDTVLQSFCERCGTRYTVTEQDTRRESGLTKIGRSLGLRSAPKPPGEPTVANALPTHDPFKATFHFCLECRQYTCHNCWNPDAGFCQTCYPIGAVALHAPERGTSPEVNLAASASPTPIAVAGVASISVPEQPTSSAWPNSDLDRAAMSAAPSPVAPRPTTDPADGPSPWGPGVAEVSSTPAWDVPSEGDRDVADEPVDPRRGLGIAAAAILRDADGPAADPRPDEAVLWGSQAPSPSDGTDADAAPTQVIDPWRGVVFSYDQPQVAASEVVESPPQPDPNLPWLAKANAAPAEPVAEALDGTAVADDTKREIDHRGWIAGSTIAAGAAWSPPVPQWPDEAAAASPLETDADDWDPVPEEQQAAVEDSHVDVSAEEDRTPPDMRDHWVAIAALGAISRDVEDHDETRSSDDDLALDSPTLVDDSAEARQAVEAWPAVDTLATVDATHDETPSTETAPAPDRVDAIVAAAAAGAVIGAAADRDDRSPRELSPEPVPEAEAPAPNLAGPVGPAVPPWIPLEAPVGGSEAPVPTGPYATSSPLPPQPPPAPIDTTPPPPLPPPPVAPIFASAAPMAMPPPIAPPPPLGMAAPPPASVGHATPHPAFVAPLLAAPGVGLQSSSGPVPPAAPMPMAAPMPTAQGPGPAGQTKAHPCQSCGLPLSAKARFCRRCGSQQAA